MQFILKPFNFETSHSVAADMLAMFLIFFFFMCVFLLLQLGFICVHITHDSEGGNDYKHVRNTINSKGQVNK